MKRNLMPVQIETPKPIQGSNGFFFEFKVCGEVLYFIRYQEGERKEVRTNSIAFGLEPRDEWGKCIDRNLRVFAGVTQYVIERAILTAAN